MNVQNCKNNNFQNIKKISKINNLLFFIYNKIISGTPSISATKSVPRQIDIQITSLLIQDLTWFLEKLFYQ